MDKKQLIEATYRKRSVSTDTNTWSNESIDTIFSVIMGDKINDLYELSADCNNHLGTYYFLVTEDIENASKCYQIAIQKGSIVALANMGNLCYQISHYEEMIKYCTISANEYNDVYSMYLLGLYYYRQGDTNHMLEYMLMAAEYDHYNALYVLGDYHRKIGKYDQMIFYYKRAIKNGSRSSMFQLGHYYEMNHNYGKMIKYFAKAIADGCYRSLESLITFYFYKYQYDCIDECLLIGLEAGISPKLIRNLIQKFEYNRFLNKLTNKIKS